MIFDTYSCIRMEHSAFPGSVGDSCAETSRAALLAVYMFNDTSHRGVLLNFFTRVGIVRHPESPWRESDTSGDQVLPLLAAVHVTGLLAPVKPLLSSRTGNGDLASPMLVSCQKRLLGKSNWFWDLAVLGQALLSKLPFRWSDSKRGFEQSSESSCDYLNLIVCLIYARMTNTETWPIKLVRSIISLPQFMFKVNSYYASEPNPFVVSWYFEALKKLYE